MSRDNEGPNGLDAPDGSGFMHTIDRRAFLKLTSTGLLVACVFDPLLGVVGGGPLDAQQAAAIDFNAFLHIGADGRVTCLVGKVEMGQGIMTALPQLVAEELGVALTAIDIVLGDTDLCPTDGGTFGSLSIRMFGPTLRAASAEARRVLVQMAAEHLHVPADQLDVRDGVVVSKTDRNAHVSYGQLTAGKKIERRVDGQAVLKNVKAFTVIGTSAPRRDAVEKVTGKAKYAGDIIPRGALHARILRAPAYGATLINADTSAAAALPGVRVVRDGDLIAVLHAHRDEATRALALIKATWTPSPSTLTDENIFDHLTTTAPEGRPTGVGDVVGGEKAAAQIVEQTYRKGYVAHSPMETHSAVAQVVDGKVTVWAGTQTPFPLKAQVARALNLPVDKVRVITPYIGGGFGGKSSSAQGLEAARLAMAAGTPVRVVWSREEEFLFDTFDPACVFKIRAGLDAAKQIVFWDNVVVGPGARGSAVFYDIPNHRTTIRGGAMGGNPAGMHPFGVGPWRAPGANANVYARESHIDMLAVKAGMDPVEFRLKNLTNPRMRRVLEAAAKQFGWTPKAGPSGRGYGVACGEDAGTSVAAIAEVKVDKSTGDVKVVRVACAQDMGIVINPEGAIQQMEGCITMGLGYTLGEEIHFKNGALLDTNFDTYDIPRFSMVPKMETVILDSDQPPQGGGEPAIILMGALVANAVFDAVGARVVQLPMTSERVKAAMKV